MFEHLDDPRPSRAGTQPQLAATRNRGRHLVAHRRRTRIATGSAALAVTAGVTAVATVGLPGGSAGAAPGAGAGTPPPSSPAPTATRATPSATATPAASTAAASPGAAQPAPTTTPTVPAPATTTAPSVPVPVTGSSVTRPATASTATAPTATAPTATAPTAGIVPPAPTTTGAIPPAPATTGAIPPAPATTGAIPPAPVTTHPPEMTEPPVSTAACAVEAALLKNSVEGSAYQPIDPGQGVIAWKHPAGPLTTLVVSVNCSPFSSDKISPESKEPVRKITVHGVDDAALGINAWLIGDASSGHLELIWNAANGTAVEILATTDRATDPVATADRLVQFGNTLVY